MLTIGRLSLRDKSIATNEASLKQIAAVRQLNSWKALSREISH